MIAKHAGCAIHTELLADAPGLNALVDGRLGLVRI